MAAAQGTSLDYPALEANEAFFFFSPGTVIIGVTQKGAHTPVWCPNFCDCCQGTPLCSLSLVANEAFAHGSHRTVTSG